MPQRLASLDLLRGLMLILISINHSPFWIKAYTEEFVGYVSAAEGFVFVSAFLAGIVFTRTEHGKGFPVAAKASFRRAWQIYVAQLLLLGALLFLSVAFHPHLAGMTEFIRPFLEAPISAGVAAAFLLYRPSLLDILPMYVLFSILTPFVFYIARRFGWGVVLSGGAILWAASQFGLRQMLFGPVQELPFVRLGAFDLFAWQIIWCFGLWLGTRWQTGQRVPEFRLLNGLAVLVAVLFLVLRWNWHLGEDFVTGSGWWLFAKWGLGPARILNFAALAWIVVLLRPWLDRLEPYVRWFSLIGRHILPVFCTQIALSVLLNGASANLRDDPLEIATWLTLQVACAFVLALALESRTPTGKHA